MGRKAIEAPGLAKEDWWITNEIGKRLGLPWSYNNPQDIYNEMALTMPSLNNITWDRLIKENSVTYPCKSSNYQEKKLYLVINFQQLLVKENLLRQKLQILMNFQMMIFQ